MTTAEKITAEYNRAYRAEWERRLNGVALEARTEALAARYGYDPRECVPGSHYAGADHAESVDAGRLSLEFALRRAAEDGRLTALNVARNRISGSQPPSVP